MLKQHPLVQAIGGGRHARPGARRRGAGLHRDARSRCRGRTSASSRAHWLTTRCAQLAYFKAPGYVAFVDALPLTPSQKIQRGELKAHGGARLPTQPHCIDTRALKRGQSLMARRGYDGVAVAVPVTRALRALLDPRRTLVPRPGGARAVRRVGLEEGAVRRPHGQQLHAGARHRGGRHAAPRVVAALARPHPHRRRDRA